MAANVNTTLVCNNAEGLYGKGALRLYLTPEEIAKFFPNGLKFSGGVKVVPNEAAEILEKKTPWFGKQFGVAGKFKVTTEVQRVKMIGEEEATTKAVKKEEAKVSALVTENEELKKKVAELEKAAKK